MSGSFADDTSQRLWILGKVFHVMADANVLVASDEAEQIVLNVLKECHSEPYVMDGVHHYLKVAKLLVTAHLSFFSGLIFELWFKAYLPRRRRSYILCTHQ